MRAKKPFDFWIFMTVLILLALGTVMVFSSSAPFAYNTLGGDAYVYLKKQLMVLPLSLGAMFFTMNFDYRKLGKLSPIILIVSIVMLILVLIPGIGLEIKGSKRWLGVGELTFQPSELAKLGVILFFSYSLSKRKDQLQYFFKGLLPYLILLGLIAGLMLIEPHKSGTIIIGSVAVIILFCAGARIKHIVAMAIPAVTGMIALILLSDYSRKRIFAFLDPAADPQGDGWQQLQSLYAIGSGGLFGRGLGKSLQKFLYIPEPHNDFILAVLAEELGFLGVMAVLILFLIFIWRGIKIAMHAPDIFGSLVAVGITSLIAVQVIINVAVVTASMPVTGVPLPFFSYGGTSLLFLMSGIGILLNISRYTSYERI